MMPVKQIIRADAYKTRKVFKKDGDNFLNVSEFYYDTIQGEGIYTGHPSAFLRLQGCIMNCQYCDTKEVWKYGSQYTFDELFELLNSTMLPTKLKDEQHLVITGGSPLLQQDKLSRFLERFVAIYDFFPFIEIENECVIMPSSDMQEYVDCWNNSPKLESSGVNFDVRYKPDVVYRMSKFENSWFKFVITKKEDWDEIETQFILPGLIKKGQIILMPEGATRAELENTRMIAIQLAVANNVRYCTREHIVLWDKTVGV